MRTPLITLIIIKALKQNERTRNRFFVRLSYPMLKNKRALNVWQGFHFIRKPISIFDHFRMLSSSSIHYHATKKKSSEFFANDYRMTTSRHHEGGILLLLNLGDIFRILVQIVKCLAYYFRCYKMLSRSVEFDGSPVKITKLMTKTSGMLISSITIVKSSNGISVCFDDRCNHFVISFTERIGKPINVSM